MSNPKAPTLDQLERWFFQIVSHPNDVATAAQDPQTIQQQPNGIQSLEDAFEPSKFLSVKQRLGIYANMYLWRLADVLSGDFQVFQETVGGHRFRHLAQEYLQRFPSRSFTLNKLGNHFPQFIAEYDPESLDNRAFLAELARLELTIQHIFDAPRDDSLDLDALMKIPDDSWAMARVQCIQALRLLAFEYPTNIYFQSSRDEQHPAIPEPKKTWVAVIRRNFTIWRYDLTREKFTLLEALENGATLAESLQKCLELPDVDTNELISSLTAWFREWTADGFFSRIDLAKEDF